jgi:DNA-binding CsgD family transcriptional regulator
MRPSGPILTVEDVYTRFAVVPDQAARACVVEAMPEIERDFGPFAGLYAWPARCFDTAARYPEVHRLEAFQRHWRPLRIERQLVALLGSAAAPAGLIGVARSAREPAFTARDLATLENIRVVVERETAANGLLGHGRLEETLRVLALASAEAWVLLDGEGRLLWLTEEALARLAPPAARLGGTVALGRCDEVELLRTWVRGEARRGGPESQAPPPAGIVRRFGDVTLRRFDWQGRSLFLVGLRQPSSENGARAARRASEFARRYGLTPRQAEVLALVARGLRNRSIGASMGCGESTVEQHVSALLGRLQCGNRAALVARFWDR